MLTKSCNKACDVPISCPLFLYGFFTAEADVTHAMIQRLSLATLLHDFNLISRDEQGMKQRSSWLSAMKNRQESDKQLHLRDCFRAKNSPNSCLLWLPLRFNFFFFKFLGFFKMWAGYLCSQEEVCVSSVVVSVLF